MVARHFYFHVLICLFVSFGSTFHFWERDFLSLSGFSNNNCVFFSSFRSPLYEVLVFFSFLFFLLLCFALLFSVFFLRNPV